MACFSIINNIILFSAKLLCYKWNKTLWVILFLEINYLGVLTVTLLHFPK